MSPIGLGASYGIDDRGVEEAFERGINYFYWGSMRRKAFGKGIARICQHHRSETLVVVQSYARVGFGLKYSLESALRKLRIDYADILLLGWWDKLPPTRIIDTALKLKEEGKVRATMMSCHHRPTFRNLIEDGRLDSMMVRYNAAHRGAEEEVFPYLPENRHEAPGVCTYTATRWGALVNEAVTPRDLPTPKASDCYRFALSHPSVDMCLAAPRDTKEMTAAFEAIEKGPLDEDEMAWMRTVGQTVRDSKQLAALPRAPRILGSR